MKEENPDALKKATIQSGYLGLNQTQQMKPSPSNVTNELPKYMKPTSRFDARKDKLHLSTNALTSSSKIKSMNNSENRISSKPVSSSDHPVSKAVAKEDLVRNSGLKPVRSSMKKKSGVGLHPTVNLSRATCSSTIKTARYPKSLDTDETQGVSNLKICSYKYCSLHGQKKHEVSLPALKCFLSARRKSVQVPNRLKQKEQPSIRKNGRNEIYSTTQEGNLQLQSCKERSQDEVEIVKIVNEINWLILGNNDETNQLQESYSVTSFEDYVDNNSEISIEVFDERIQYIEDERQKEAHLETEEGKIGYVDWEEAAGPYLHSQSNSSQCFDDFLGQTLLPEVDDIKVDHEIQQSTTFSYSNEEKYEESANRSIQSEVKLPNSPKELLEADFENLEAHCEEEHDMKVNVKNVECCEPSEHETNYESQPGIRRNYYNDGDISDGLENEKENLTNSASFISENPLTELTNRPKEKYSTTRKITAENQENTREFNPRQPSFLPLKPQKEAEVVNLKHQTMEERKTAEEWMIDYALRNTLTRMAPARKRKVALLVAAFESVIQREQCTTVP